MNDVLLLTGQPLSIDRIQAAVAPDVRLRLSAEARDRIDACRTYLEERIATSDDLFYGINTGLGSLCNVAISREEIRQLQVNLVRSHACGVGERVPADIVRTTLFLKIHALTLGHSGCRTVLVDRLIDLYNQNILPVLYEYGSLGASGDLAPLAHLSLPLFGEGEVEVNGETMPADRALADAGIEPLTLEAKEGLALLNGTQFMNAYGLHLCWEGRELLRKMNKVAALSMDVYRCHLEPFRPEIHAVRRQRGQAVVAAEIMGLLNGSEFQDDTKTDVQDPYSFRCIPQVHGASLDVLDHVARVMEDEANSATDNPLVFPDDDAILSGGNFHGQPLALGLDYLALALSELGSISERRLYKLVSGRRGLPAYLVERPGLNSGLMIAQYTAASIVSHNKQLCTPASVDTIPSSAGQEDHVSMGANSATKAYRVFRNTQQLAAIEWLAAAQGLEFRRPMRSSSELERSVAAFRDHVPPLQEDAFLAPLVEASVRFLRS